MTRNQKERQHFKRKINKRKYTAYYPKKLDIVCKEDCENCPYKKCCSY